MLEAYQSIGQFQGASKTELMTWMKKIAIHNLHDEARRYQGTKRRDSSREVALGDTHQQILRSKTNASSELAGRRESEECLINALKKLPERQREVIEARHKEGRSYRQIADQPPQLPDENLPVDDDQDPIVERLEQLWNDRGLAPKLCAADRLGQYQLLEVGGFGSFGVVYKALDQELGRLVALKVPRMETLFDPDKRKRFTM